MGWEILLHAPPDATAAPPAHAGDAAEWISYNCYFFEAGPPPNDTPTVIGKNLVLPPLS